MFRRLHISAEWRDLAKQKGVTFRTAAYAIALQRVAEAERLRGN